MAFHWLEYILFSISQETSISQSNFIFWQYWFKAIIHLKLESFYLLKSVLYHLTWCSLEVRNMIMASSSWLSFPLTYRHQLCVKLKSKIHLQLNTSWVCWQRRALSICEERIVIHSWKISRENFKWWFKILFQYFTLIAAYHGYVVMKMIKNRLSSVSIFQLA